MPDVDVLIIGGGLMGATVAQTVRTARPNVMIAVVDAGPPLGPIAGEHVHEFKDPGLWASYNDLPSAGVPAVYTGFAPRTHLAADLADVEPGMYFLSDFKENSGAMPGSALGWNSGGMGIHWTAATPLPYGDEVPAFIDPAAWARDLKTAQDVLRVHPHPFVPNAEGILLLEELSRVFGASADPGRGPQRMPMAIVPDRDGHATRVGPGVIFPPLRDGGDPAFQHLSETLCLKIMHDGERAIGAHLRNSATGHEHDLTANAVVVCADAMRTPQLLWASDVRPTALGRNLNEHAFISGQVVVDLDRFGIDPGSLSPPRHGETMTGVYWLPHSNERQPTQGQIMTRPILADDLLTPVGLVTLLSWYVPMGTHEASYLEFSAQERDLVGLPKITVHFTRTEKDQAALEAGRAQQRKAGEALGTFDPETESVVLPPGSSRHYTGTVRMGTADDGSSVCDQDGRVWGMQNLYVAGNGVVPTRLACNSTLIGAVTAVRAGRAAAACAGEA